MNLSPSFGTMIRAYRLGWGLSRKHGAFVRMSDASGGRFLIELCPVNAVPSKNSPQREHRCWWEAHDGGQGVLDNLPWLRTVVRIKRYIAVYVNEAGTIVEIAD